MKSALHGEDHGHNATRSPAFCTLLELEEHVATVLIIVEEVHIVDDQHQWFASSFHTSQGDLFQFIHR
jgi:hypothetical protein